MCFRIRVITYQGYFQFVRCIIRSASHKRILRTVYRNVYRVSYLKRRKCGKIITVLFAGWDSDCSFFRLLYHIPTRSVFHIACRSLVVLLPVRLNSALHCVKFGVQPFNLTWRRGERLPVESARRLHYKQSLNRRDSLRELTVRILLAVQPYTPCARPEIYVRFFGQLSVNQRRVVIRTSAGEMSVNHKPIPFFGK